MPAKPKAKLRWVTMEYALIDDENRQLGIAHWNFASNAYELWVGGLHQGYAKNEVLAKDAIQECFFRKAVRGKK